MCSVRTESCCSIWLNCLSGSMQTDNCLDPPAHKLESTRLFVQGLSLFTCWKSLLKVIWPFLRENRNCLRKITVFLFCIHVAHKLPGPSWKRQSTISRFCWKNFPRLVPNHRWVQFLPYKSNNVSLDGWYRAPSSSESRSES